MKKENAINFLLYSYFGVTLESKKEEIINAAINRAYRDASSHVLSIEDSVKNKYKGNGTTKINDFINEENQKSDTYDSKFRKLCCNLVKDVFKDCTYKDDNLKFSYGIAQKWVNMTMKYLCVIKSVFKVYGKEAHLDFLDAWEKDLHIPIDGYILEAAVSKEIKYKDTTYGHGLEMPIPGKEEGKNVTSYNDKVLPWSKWEEKHYRDFADKLRETVMEMEGNESPLDWEGPAWIAVAQKRKASEEKSETPQEG